MVASSSVSRLLLTLLPILVLSSSPGLSEESTATKTTSSLERLEMILTKEPGLSPEARQALLDVLESLERGGDTGPTGEPDSTREPAIWETIFSRLSLYGDLRLRHESSFELDDRKDRHRQRIRLRLGAVYEIVDELKVGARVSTGQRTDANSPHTTLGTGFDRLEVNFDRAFLTYEPKVVEGLSVTGGKFGHSFLVNPVYGELEWDADVQPEGLLLSHVWKGKGAVQTIEFRLGEYILIEQGGADEALATVGQIGTRLRLGESWKGLAALGYCFYTDATPEGSQSLLGDDQGNALRDRNGDGNPDDFVSDFGILHPVLAFTYTGACCPITLAAEGFWNTRAETSRELGGALGIAFGSSSRQGDIKVAYQWQLIQQDAIFSPVAQDDFLLATNQRGHLLSFNYQVLDQVGLRAWLLVSEREDRGTLATTDSRHAQWRARFDINVKF